MLDRKHTTDHSGCDICYRTCIHDTVDSHEDREDHDERQQEENLSRQRHEDTKLRFTDRIEEIRSYRLDAVDQGEEHINPEIPFGELIVKFASFSEDTDDLSWEKLEACKRNQRQEGSGSKC